MACRSHCERNYNLGIGLTIVDKSCSRGVEPEQAMRTFAMLPRHVKVLQQPNLGLECAAYLSSNVHRHGTKYGTGLASHTWFLLPDHMWDTEVIPQPWLTTHVLTHHNPVTAFLRILRQGMLRSLGMLRPLQTHHTL